MFNAAAASPIIEPRFSPRYWYLCLLLSSWMLLALWVVLEFGPSSAKDSFWTPMLQSPAFSTRRDVVLVTVDSLRADHVGAYGYKRPTTPNLDRLARRGVRFEHAYAQAPHTSFSIASLLTGRYFATLTRLVPAARFETLAGCLAAHGWSTAAIYPPAIYLADEEKLVPYRAQHFGFKFIRHGYLSADQSVDEAISFYERERPAQALLWLHLFEPHEPYDAAATSSFGPGDIDRYDQEIVVADAALGRLSQYLGKHRPGAVLIVTADHGESFDEHDERYHGTNLHEEQIRVPLVIAAPGIGPRIVNDPVQLVDVFPTVLGLTSTVSQSATDGQDLSYLLQDGPKQDRAVFAALGVQRMIVRGKSKLIWDLQKGNGQLFDLKADPAELHDLSQDQSSQSALLRNELYRWIDARLVDAIRLHADLASPEVPESILRARLGDAESADSLVTLLSRQGSLAERREAAMLLLRLPPRLSTFPTLVGLRLDDPVINDWVSVAAFRLGFQPAQRKVEELLAGTTPDFELRLRAAEALAWRQARGTAPVLLRLLDSCPDVDSCRQVIGALGRLGDRSAGSALAMELKNPMLQRESIRALGQLGGPESIALLVDCLLHDERALARVEAARALRTSGGPLVKYSLWQAVLRDPEQAVRDAAWRTLADLADSVGHASGNSGVSALGTQHANR